jgi:hypothetical protein
MYGCEQQNTCSSSLGVTNTALEEHTKRTVWRVCFIVKDITQFAMLMAEPLCVHSTTDRHDPPVCSNLADAAVARHKTTNATRNCSIAIDGVLKGATEWDLWEQHFPREWRRLQWGWCGAATCGIMRHYIMKCWFLNLMLVGISPRVEVSAHKHEGSATAHACASMGKILTKR